MISAQTLTDRLHGIDWIKERVDRKTLIIAGIAVSLLLVARITFNLFCFESTDDAFLKAHVHTVSSRIPGTVQKIFVEDNQIVKKGDVLVELDARDYAVQVQIAQANYSKAHKDVGRFNAFAKDLGPTDRPIFDQYQANALVSEADLTKAQLQYEYTKIVAAEDGKIGKRNVETGEQIQPGQALMALVEPRPWIEANFKENQVAHMHVGQKAQVRVDALGVEFEGRVDSIAPGSGSTFSLLPPDNATGNFTKIVQRIPVRIVFDPESIKGYEERLVSGMSAEVSVRVH